MRTRGFPATLLSPGRMFGLGSLTVGLLQIGGCVGMSDRPPVVAPPPLGQTAGELPERRHPAVPPAPKKAVAEKHPAKSAEQPPEKQASVDPESLLGLGPDVVLKRLGAPARIENGPLSREWIYAASGCSFRVFFYPDMNSTSFKVLKYGSRRDNGEWIDSSNVCVRHILTARDNDAGN
ncbi:MAG TPA: hypothetical protein VG867_09955 [Rhizomicrobium sp.]|nr:hypothetical protein [Rhizomicrobium sp.]